MKALTTLFLLSLIAPLANSQDVHRAKITDISVVEQQTPQFSVSGPKDKKVKPREWFELEAEIEVETKSTSGFIPELTANWYVIMGDKPNKQTVRLSGKTTFKNVRCADGKAYISAYIEPDTIERLTGQQKASARDLKAIALVLSGTNILSDKKHIGGLTMVTAEKDLEWWLTSKYKSLDDLIVAKSKTPFAPLWVDRYPTEDSNAR